MSNIITNLTYTNEIKEQITASGGTVIFVKDNIIVASEISEAQYRELLNSPLVNKLDVLPLKRYANEGIKYTESTIQESVSNTTVSNASNIIKE